jgi:hypothetical protein
VTYLEDQWIIAANSTACCDFPAEARFCPLAHHFGRDMAPGTHDITRIWTESIALSCPAPHLDRAGHDLEKSQQDIVFVG